MGIADQLREKAHMLQERAKQAMSGKDTSTGSGEQKQSGTGQRGDMSERGKDMGKSSMDDDRDRGMND
ncbi:hypothetical protein [Streptomyces hainanensis]|uniref:Uncharacterized protein n=1 Tax=Streptomyces hainanensis TaxID=402648 RepID=A0A4R4TJB1_9ACTN|nr:hypothetical protein [Streptomyces hainanensis]TDC75854.1 hypothetical protein E1283_11235 [Streptomyces hainanensis]